MTIFFAVRTRKLLGGYDPFFAMISKPAEAGETIDLWALEYMFAVQKLDPKYGHISVEHI